MAAPRSKIIKSYHPSHEDVPVRGYSAFPFNALSGTGVLLGDKFEHVQERPLLQHKIQAAFAGMRREGRAILDIPGGYSAQNILPEYGKAALKSFGCDIGLINLRQATLDTEKFDRTLDRIQNSFPVIAPGIVIIQYAAAFSDRHAIPENQAAVVDALADFEVAAIFSSDVPRTAFNPPVAQPYIPPTHRTVSIHPAACQPIQLGV
jgi:hypothetical protein